MDLQQVQHDTENEQSQQPDQGCANQQYQGSVINGRRPRRIGGAKHVGKHQCDCAQA